MQGTVLLEAMQPGVAPFPRRGGADPLLADAIAHGVVGLIGSAVPLEHLSPAWSSSLRVQEAWARRQLETATELTEVLDRHGVRAVFVKGVALALQVYGRPVLRPFGDLDLLVDPASTASAHRSLVEAGFAPLPARDGVRMEADYVRREPSGISIWVDLHWKFTGSDSLQAPVRIPVDEILHRSRRVDGLPVPADEDSLLLAAANLVRSCADRLILFVDFARLAGRPIDWNAVEERAGRWGLRTPAWLGLRIAADRLGARVPAEVVEALAPPAWKRRMLLGLLDGEALCRPGKSRDLRYRYLLKALCLDGWGATVSALTAIPRRALKRLGAGWRLAPTGS